MMPVSDFYQQNGLMVACCKGFLDIVHKLHDCPFIDVNLQDNEGNTALMIASQGGECNEMQDLYSMNDVKLRCCGHIY